MRTVATAFWLGVLACLVAQAFIAVLVVGAVLDSARMCAGFLKHKGVAYGLVRPTP